MNGEPRIPLASTGGPGYGTRLDSAVAGFAAATMRLRHLDPVVTELVRLKCADFHDCRQCQSLRLGEAIRAGVDETMAGKVARFETSDLDERLKVALRFTEATIILPALLTPELVVDLRRHYSPAQIVELTLDIMKWSQQKPQVSLRIEAPRAEGLTLMDFDDRGDFVRGGALSAG